MQNSPPTQINAPTHGIKLLALAGALTASLAAPVVAWASSPVLKSDSYATSASVTVHGAEPSILINPSNTGYLQYGLGLSLPTGTTGQDIDKATLKVYISSVAASGTLTIRKVTSVWNESTLSQTTLPTLDVVTIPKTFSIPKSFVGKFVQLDVTDLVKDWTDTPSTNFGLAMSVESGSLLSFAIDSKENTGAGHEAYLDVVLKTVSTAIQNALDLKADLASPALTGTPTAPTASAGDNTTQIATTEFVANAVAATTHAIGEAYGGGIVFYVNSTGTHGLIAATQNQVINVTWYAAHNAISSVANYDTAGQDYTDWRLPTSDELNRLYQQRLVVGGFAFCCYWSSSDSDASNGWVQNFNDGSQYIYNKTVAAFAVRAVRAF